MYRFLNERSWLLFLCMGILFAYCNKEFSKEEEKPAASGKITLVLQHSVRTLPLNYTDQYTTDLGETYRVTRFRYYVHNIELINKAGAAISVLPGYFLVDEDVPASKNLSFSAPADDYTAIAFTLGVDSADNMSGAQAGALDPANGMFWTWTSGYVMAKLEGTSPAVTGASNSFSYHVGGYKSPYAVIKKIRIPVQSPNSLEFAKDTLINLHVNADINTWFNRVNPILMSLTPACHSPGDLAKKIADNYEGMFSLINIE